MSAAQLIFGGTFNPIHFGHTGVAHEVAEQLNIGRVRFIPNGDPPHRQRPRVSAEDRLVMLQTTLRDLQDDNICFCCDDIEVRRQGKSYTFDTIHAIRQNHEDNALFLLLGQDAFDGFYRWYRADDLAQLCTIIVMNRPGYDSGLINEENAQALEARTLKKVQFVQITPRDISSTQIRAAFQSGNSKAIRQWLNPEVFQYIEDNQFYA